MAVVGYLVDLFSKMAAVAYLDPVNPPVFLGGLLKLQLARNPGAAFSLGSELTVVLSVFALIALVFVLVYAILKVDTKVQAFVAGLLLAGIAGNLTDRLFREPGPFQGHVVDMFQLPYFAIFNVADICITCAAALLVILAFRKES